ncbi:aldehyde dehydrogenase family protein [Pseudomonas sp. RGM2987]|nr:aldehyde dehydrogenase family protein [Pseudomonas sp. RGM2987]
MQPFRRRQILDRFADLIEQNMQRFMNMAVVENGIPMSTMVHGMAPRILGWTRYYAGWADKIEGVVTGINPGDNFEYTVPEPYGVIGHIITWNAPLLSLAMKIPPSLAAGNTVVITAEFTPFSSQLFVELGLEAGVPPGVINVVPGGIAAGEALVRHRGVDKISFTGGPVGARSIMRSAAETLKPCVFELGGKSANLVFPDIDIPGTAAYCAAFGLSNSGQGCALPTRMMIHESIYEPFVQAVQATMEQLPYGDPLNENVIVGPMVNAVACERVQGMIGEAREQQIGHFLTGGEAAGDGRGNFVTPTLISEADPYSTIAQKEVFGPVLCAFKFRDEAEAVALANATEYGLAAYVQTNDLNIAQRMVRQLNAGTVFVNQATPASLAASPFGGVGLSGFGREGGKAGLDEFIRLKGVGMSVRAS